MTRLSRAATIAQEGSLYVLLFLLPFSNAVIEIAFGVLLLSWLFQRCYPATRADTIWLRPSLRPLVLSLLIFLAACAASIAVSRDPMLSVRSLVSKWLESLLFLVLVADVANRKGVVDRALLSLCGSSLLVVIEAVVQEITGWGLLRRYPLGMYGRMTGPYHNPSDLATYLMVIIPILVMYALASGRWRRRWLTGLIAILLLCLARTESRGAWLGLAVGVVVIAWQPGRYRRYAAILGGGLMVAAIAFLSWAGHLSALHSSSQIGNVDRWHMWLAAWGMIKDHPVLGLGLNTFMANYLDYWVGGERMPRYAHNCYLQVAAETGLIGLGAFLWVLWALFARVVTAVRRASRAEQALLVGWCAGLAAFVVQAAVDTNFYSLRQAALFWILSGAAVGLSVRATDMPRR